MKRFPLPPIFILALALLWFAPATGAAGAKDSPKIPWIVNYHDGSGNGYRFWKDSENEACFEYTPVQPQESSTGMYSGGKPLMGVMSDKQVGELWKRVLRLESDAALRTKERMKGTGAFQLKEPGGNRDFIILDGDPLKAWNQFLSAFRRGKQGLVPQK